MYFSIKPRTSDSSPPPSDPVVLLNLPPLDPQLQDSGALPSDRGILRNIGQLAATTTTSPATQLEYPHTGQ